MMPLPSIKFLNNALHNFFHAPLHAHSIDGIQHASSINGILEVKSDAEKILTTARIMYGCAILFVIIAISGVVFSLLNNAFFLFAFSLVGYIISQDFRDFSFSIIKVAKKMQASPSKFTQFNRNRRFEIFKDNAINSTIALGHFVNINQNNLLPNLY